MAVRFTFRNLSEILLSDVDEALVRFPVLRPEV